MDYEKRQAAITLINSIPQEFPAFEFKIKAENPRVIGTFIIKILVSCDYECFLALEMWNQPRSNFSFVRLRSDDYQRSQTNYHYPEASSPERAKEIVIEIIKRTDKYRIWRLENEIEELRMALLCRPSGPGPDYLEAEKSFNSMK